MRAIDADALKQKSFGKRGGLIHTADVDGMPTIICKPQWIPCSETVDIPVYEVLACSKYGTQMVGFLVYEDDQWLCASDNTMMYDPIAWMPLPEAYRERRADKC